MASLITSIFDSLIEMWEANLETRVVAGDRRATKYIKWGFEGPLTLKKPEAEDGIEKVLLLSFLIEGAFLLLSYFCRDMVWTSLTARVIAVNGVVGSGRSSSPWSSVRYAFSVSSKAYVSSKNAVVPSIVIVNQRLVQINVGRDTLIGSDSWLLFFCLSWMKAWNVSESGNLSIKYNKVQRDKYIKNNLLLLYELSAFGLLEWGSSWRITRVSMRIFFSSIFPKDLNKLK